MTRIYCFLRPDVDEHGMFNAIAITDAGREVGRGRHFDLEKLIHGMAKAPTPEVQAKYDAECPEGWTVEWIERNDPRPDVLKALRLLTDRRKNYRFQEMRHKTGSRQAPRPKPGLFRLPGRIEAHYDFAGRDVHVDLDAGEPMTRGWTWDPWDNLEDSPCRHRRTGDYDPFTGRPRQSRGFVMCVQCVALLYANDQGGVRRIDPRHLGPNIVLDKAILGLQLQWQLEQRLEEVEVTQ